jgi:hypothetical protein
MRRLLLLLLVACTSPTPTPTATTCANPDPVVGTTTLTWDTFGCDFMKRYCVNCHASSLPPSQRNGAPLFHDFDSLAGVMDAADHVDQFAGWGPAARNSFMPGGGTGGRCPSLPGGALDRDCPAPTDAERAELAQWLACEVKRPHDFTVNPGLCR